MDEVYAKRVNEHIHVMVDWFSKALSFKSIVDLNLEALTLSLSLALALFCLHWRLRDSQSWKTNHARSNHQAVMNFCAIRQYRSCKPVYSNVETPADSSTSQCQCVYCCYYAATACARAIGYLCLYIHLLILPIKRVSVKLLVLQIHRTPSLSTGGESSNLKCEKPCLGRKRGIIGFV